MQEVRRAASVVRCASVGVALLEPGWLCHRGAMCNRVVTEPVHRNDTGTVALQSLTKAHMGTFLYIATPCIRRRWLCTGCIAQCADSNRMKGMAVLPAGFEMPKFPPGRYYLRPLLSLAETCHVGFSMGGMTSLPALCVCVCVCARARTCACVRVCVRARMYGTHSARRNHFTNTTQKNTGIPLAHCPASQPMPYPSDHNAY